MSFASDVRSRPAECASAGAVFLGVASVPAWIGYTVLGDSIAAIMGGYGVVALLLAVVAVVGSLMSRFE